MSAQHTPGPWIAERDYGSSHFSEVWSKHTSNSVAKIVEKRNGTVHVSYGEVWNTALTAETDANARLIAAAPVMYEALQKVSQTITMEHSLRPDYGWKEWLENEILPALKAATGE